MWWHTVTHGRGSEGETGKCSTLHTTWEHGVSSITTADAHTSAASSRLNWRPPADLNGLVRFAERRNLFSAHVPSQFDWPPQKVYIHNLVLTITYSFIAYATMEWFKMKYAVSYGHIWGCIKTVRCKLHQLLTVRCISYWLWGASVTDCKVHQLLTVSCINYWL